MCGVHHRHTEISLATNQPPYYDSEPDTSRGDMTSDDQTQKPSKTNEEWMVHYLKETADQAERQTMLIESIKGWVRFFGILTVISLVLWASITWIS